MLLYINTKDQKTLRLELREGKKIIDSLVEENKYGSQVLLPSIIRILQNNGLEFKDLHQIEVEDGPGSYTGLRVGVSVAQALGFALNIPVNGRLNKPIRLRYT